jgi:hypothetical protein
MRTNNGKHGAVLPAAIIINFKINFLQAVQWPPQ